MRILIINGPNLQLLGTRDPELYGSATPKDLEQQWHDRATVHAVSVEAMQSNHEGDIVDAIGEGSGRFDALIINAGALSHYSRSIADAIEAVELPAVEVHISNIYEREEWRHVSVLEEVCVKSIVGRGTDGYLNAIDHVVALLGSPPLTVQYGEHDNALLDLRTPGDGGPFATAILIHGGFWQDIWKRDLMDPMATALVEHGWATVNIEYTTGPASYPDARSDVHAAIAWVSSNAETHSLDENRIVVIGHSAGGYLAMSCAKDSSGLLGVIGLGAVSDLESLSASRPENDPVAAFLGSSQADAPRLWLQASLSHAPTVPAHLIHGADDTDVDPSQSSLHAEAASNTTAEIIPNATHMDLINPRATSWPTILDALDSLIEKK